MIWHDDMTDLRTKTQLQDDLEARIRIELQCWVRNCFELFRLEGFSHEIARQTIFYTLLSSLAGGLLVDKTDAKHASELLRKIIEK
jgi:hypothetical protein